MTMITTSEVTNEEGTLEVTVTAGKRTYSVLLRPDGWVHVFYLNARRRSALGRAFQTFDEAREGYESSIAKQAINEAKEAFAMYRSSVVTNFPATVWFYVMRDDDADAQRGVAHQGTCEETARRFLDYFPGTPRLIATGMSGHHSSRHEWAPVTNGWVRHA